MQAVALKCSSCGAGLSIPPDINQLACGFCGTAQVVERGGGIIALKPVTDAIKHVQAGTDKTAAELALNRLSQELQTAANQRNQAFAYWQQQYNLAGASVINTTIFLAAVSGIVCLIGLDIFMQLFPKAIYIPEPWTQAVAFFLAAAAGGLLGAFIFMKGKTIAREKEMKVASRRDAALQEVDAQLKFINEQIKKNRMIVNS